MKRRDFLHAITLASGAAVTGLAADRPAPTATAAVPAPVGGGETLLHRAQAWDRLRADVAAVPASVQALAKEAAAWRTGDLPSVVRKAHPSPSGDPHDYYSIAPYAWPDPKRPDGKPWITRDGETNPEFYKYDSQALETLCTAVQRLSVHAFAADAAADARRAGRFLRTWFVEPATRMNPHLNFAQAIPGRHTGSATGIIDTTSLIFLFDAVTGLPLNEEWTAQDLAATRAWAAQYVEWLLGSAPGKKEGAAQNNHGTWYDAQVACFALFAGRPEIARTQIEKSARQRIATQIEPDGRQPHELR
ncbi:MAG: alginate lyase family protein, partial [Verrucomicrobiota bacterium]